MIDVLGALGGLLKLIPDAIKAWGSIKERFKRPSEAPAAAPEDIARRFVRLFKAHGVRRSQIPSFFGHGLTLSSVSDDRTLLTALTDSMLGDAAGMFGIHSEWMYGATDKIYEPHDFYKHPEEFLEFLEGLIRRSGAGALECYAIVSDTYRGWHNNSLILIAERIGNISERSVYRYHLCDGLGLGYWKSNVDFYVCLAIAYQHQVYPLGRVVPDVWLKQHAEGYSLFQYLDSDGIDIPECGRWCPDQVVDDPDLFIERIDKEGKLHGQGHVLAVERWLSYCSDERFTIYDADFKPRAQKAFEDKLRELGQVAFKDERWTIDGMIRWVGRGFLR